MSLYVLKDDNRRFNVERTLKNVCIILFGCFILSIFIVFMKFWLSPNNSNIINNGIRKELLHSERTENGNLYSDGFHPCSERNVSVDALRIVCYYVIPNNITHSRQLPPSFVDPYLCTHIIVGFASISNGSLAPESSEILKVYRTIVSFKQMNPSLKVLLSVEDISNNGEFARLVSKEDLRIKFPRETLTFLEQYNFDGIDLDWEFPSWPTSDPDQIRNFTSLLQNLRQEMECKSNQSYILSVAVGAPEAIVKQSYSIQDMAKYVDFVNLMSYDFHMYTPYLPLTGPNSPLYSRPNDKGFLQNMNTNWSAWHWVESGMPRSKINIGIPTFGHSFKLVNEDNNGWNAPASGFGKIGKGGFTSFPDACHFILKSTTTQIFDNKYLVPYAFNGDEWISYDDQLSVQYKAEYIKVNNFGGAMIYSLNSDDFYGECKVLKFPLLRKVSSILSDVLRNITSDVGYS